LAEWENSDTEEQSSRRGGQRRGARPSRRRGGGQWFSRRRKKCMFCEEKVTHIDYKQADLLRGFLTDRGKMLPFVVEPGRSR
jgi:small subunit ribosomal protein S18